MYNSNTTNPSLVKRTNGFSKILLRVAMESNLRQMALKTFKKIVKGGDGLRTWRYLKLK